MELIAPSEDAVDTSANSADPAMPKRTSLPSMLPPVSCALGVWVAFGGASAGLPAGFHRINGGSAEREQDGHDAKQNPTVPFRPDHAAEAIGERRTQHKDEYDLRKIGKRRGVFVRVRRIGVEEAAAVTA